LVDELQAFLKHYRDWVNTLDTAESKGIEQGLVKGIKQGLVKGIEKGKKDEKIEIAILSLNQGLDIKTISLITGLTTLEIEKLNQRISKGV